MTGEIVRVITHEYVRNFLTNRAELLAAEKPEYVFKTRDPYKIVFRNNSGTDVYGELFHGYIFFFPVPGVLEKLEYEGLGLPSSNPLTYFAYYTEYADGTWEGLGRRSQPDVPLEEVKFGLTIYGTNVTIKPFGPDMDIAQRLLDVFKKYHDFERTAKKKPMVSKAYHDFARVVRRLRGRQPQRLLLGPPY